MNHEPLPAQGPVDVNVMEHIGYCPVCETNRPSLPEPAEGTLTAMLLSLGKE